MNANVKNNGNQKLSIDYDPNVRSLIMTATSFDGESENGENIQVQIKTTCHHVGEDLKLLETATCAYFLKAFPRIVPEDRISMVDQYTVRLRNLLLSAVNALQSKTSS